MGETPRVNFPGLIYHVIHRGNNRQVVFVEPDDYQTFLNNIKRYKKLYRFQLFAFCLMANHIHLLIKTSEQAGISRIIQSVMVAYTRFFNDKYSRCGHLWQGRFKSPVVSDDEYLLNVTRYIEQNPIRAGLVDKAGDYPWNSCFFYVRGLDGGLLDIQHNSCFTNFGNDFEEQARFYGDWIAEPLEDFRVAEIRSKIQKGEHYISPKFEGQIGRLLKSKKKTGRPVKKIFLMD